MEMHKCWIVSCLGRYPSHFHMNGDMSGSYVCATRWYSSLDLNRRPRDYRSSFHTTYCPTKCVRSSGRFGLWIFPRVSSDCDSRTVVKHNRKRSYSTRWTMHIRMTRAPNPRSWRMSDFPCSFREFCRVLEFERSFNYSIVYCHWQFGLVVVFVSIDDWVGRGTHFTILLGNESRSIRA